MRHTENSSLNLKTRERIGILIFTSGFFWWLFWDRYLKYADCIEAANSSCVTNDGDNLTSAGMIWLVPALVFAVLALIVTFRQ